MFNTKRSVGNRLTSVLSPLPIFALFKSSSFSLHSAGELRVHGYADGSLGTSGADAAIVEADRIAGALAPRIVPGGLVISSLVLDDPWVGLAFAS